MSFIYYPEFNVTEETTKDLSLGENIALEAQSVGTIKAMFKQFASYVEINQKLADRINQFQVGFVNKNEDHMAFFGGNLTGVQVVRFTSDDLAKFYTDVLQVDDAELLQELHNLSVINTDRVVSSDLLPHTCLWLIHEFMHSKLATKSIERVIESLNLIMLYKFLTSLLFNYFRYPADPQVAQATYAQMSNKFIIKQLGSWSAVLENRTKDICDKKGLHYNTIYNYIDDERILYVITDSQSRIRDMLKNIYAEFLMVHERGMKIKTSSSSFEYEGEEVLKEFTKNLNTYIHYSLAILSEQNSYIKEEILDVLQDIVHTAPKKLVKEVLIWMSDNYRFHHNKDIEHLVKQVLLHSFSYLKDNKTSMRGNTDLIYLCIRLKGIYMSSKTQNAEIKEIRNLSEKIVQKAKVTRNSSMVISVRVAVMLYIVLRAFTMHQY